MIQIKPRHIVIAILGGIGLYAAAIALAFFVGIVAGFVTYDRPAQSVEVVRYVSHPAASAESPSVAASPAARAQ